MKLSSSYPILELAGFTGLPYGALLTASDCLCGKHNGNCSAAWKTIKAKLEERQQVLLCFVLMSIAVSEYNFPLAVMSALAVNQPTPLEDVDDVTIDIFVVDLDQR